MAEREINLWDMFWASCLKWRSILVCAMVFAVLAGGYSYYKSDRSINYENQLKEVSLESLEEALTYEERETSNVYFEYKEMYDDLKYYADNAPLMMIDANSFYTGELAFHVDNHYSVEYPQIVATDNITAIINCYKSTVDSEKVAEEIEEIVGEVNDISYALELIDFSGLYGGENKIEEDITSGVFSVMIYAKNKEECEKVTNIVKENVLGSANNVIKQYGDHDITVLKHAVSPAASKELLNTQKLSIDALSACSNTMYTLATRFSDKQKSYINRALEDMTNEETTVDNKEESAVNKVPTVSLKLVVVGFAAGIILTFAFWVLVYILDKRVRLEEDFEIVFGKKLIGKIKITQTKKKKWLAVVDNVVLKFRHYNQRYFEREDAIDMITANIRIAATKAEIKKVVMTSIICDETDKELVNAIGERLKNDAIEVELISSILYNAEALEKVAKIGYVVLLERAEKSLYSEIEKTIAVCEQQEVDIIGCVLAY